jgi:hypothetical protein
MGALRPEKRDGILAAGKTSYKARFDESPEAKAEEVQRARRPGIVEETHHHAGGPRCGSFSPAVRSVKQKERHERQDEVSGQRVTDNRLHDIYFGYFSGVMQQSYEV